jgi:predicted RNase H-like HicB family nuclease
MPEQTEIGPSMSKPSRIELKQAEDTGGGGVSTDLDSGVASQGETRIGALKNLDEAVELYLIDNEYNPEEEREILEEIGLDPEEIEAAQEENRELPEFMQ